MLLSNVSVDRRPADRVLVAITRYLLPRRCSTSSRWPFDLDPATFTFVVAAGPPAISWRHRPTSSTWRHRGHRPARQRDRAPVQSPASPVRCRGNAAWRHGDVTPSTAFSVLQQPAVMPLVWETSLCFVSVNSSLFVFNNHTSLCCVISPNGCQPIITPYFMAALCNRAGHIYFHPVVCYGRPA